MPKHRNERKTENLVRDALTACGYDFDGPETLVEEQRTEIEEAHRLLKSASKAGGRGVGAPEFIISSDNARDVLAIIECKADPSDHESPVVADIIAGRPIAEDDDAYRRRVNRFAVDGALHYARALSRSYDVVALAASGETASAFTVSAYLYPKGADRPKVLRTKLGAVIDRFVRWKELVEHARFDETVQKLRHDELMGFARDLHKFMRSRGGLIENEKPLLVGGTLLALMHPGFAASFDLHRPADLQKEWLNAIKSVVRTAQIPNAKKVSMVQPYTAIAVHPKLGKRAKGYPKGILNELIRQLRDKVMPFISYYHEYDVVGQFYGEFLRYTGGDKKGLGIVLTPRHVTELFALLANVNRRSKVLDICAGTGGFLISAMVQMARDARTDKDLERIKAHGLIGVEDQPHMFALAASNMIFRGDGKANLYQGSCFDAHIVREVKAHRTDVGLLNPPFSQDEEDLRELVFVKQMLDCLRPGGIGIAIVPMNRAIRAHQARVELLKVHTLEAVMSMPDDLFYPVGTVTCVMVFTAHRSHASSNRKTWFGYWKSDGFVKTKHRGRIDLNGTWPAIRDRWVEAFRNREVRAGESVMQQVSATDEWCAEAYMDTDYSRITRADFEAVVRNFAIHRLLGAQLVAPAIEDEDAEGE